MTPETGRDRLRREDRSEAGRRYYVTGGVSPRLDQWFEENWPECLDAQFWLLSDIEPELARGLAERLVDGIITGAGLDPEHRREALEQVCIEAGVLLDGRRVVLTITLPLGSGRPSYEWDGSIEEAETLVLSAAERGVEDLTGDRSMGYPTGWELAEPGDPTTP